jgi:SEL1 protein
MTAKGIGVVKHCQTAVTGFKNVAERGDWMASLTAAHREFTEGNTFKAALIFGKLATLGVETAQSNAAFLLAKVPCPAW